MLFCLIAGAYQHSILALGACENIGGLLSETYHQMGWQTAIMPFAGTYSSLLKPRYVGPVFQWIAFCWVTHC